MDLKEKILVALGLNEEEVKLGWQGKSEDGTIFVSTAEELEAGEDSSVLLCSISFKALSICSVVGFILFYFRCFGNYFFYCTC